MTDPHTTRYASRNRRDDAMAVPKKKQSKARGDKRKATGRRSRPRTARARSASSPSSRTGCAATAATTPAVRRSRSSDARDAARRGVVLPGPEALDDALGVPFPDAALRAPRSPPLVRVRAGVAVHERAARVPGRLRARARRHRHGVRRVPEMPEGQLAKLRAAIVNMQALADVARSLRLGDLVLLGKGEEQSGGRDKASILADALEAVIGAVYLDLGLDESRRADRAAVPPADGGVGARRGRPRLQDDPAGARLARAAHDPRVPPRRARSRPREGVHGDRVPRRRGTGRGRRQVEEGSRAAGRARGVRPHLASDGGSA